MAATLLLLGLACGLCWAALALALWAGARRADMEGAGGRALALVSWLGAGALCAAAVAGLGATTPPDGRWLRAALVAALAAPVSAKRWHSAGARAGLALLPGAGAAGAALALALVGGPLGEAHGPAWAAWVALAGGGLALRVLGDALAGHAPPAGWALAATLLVSTLGAGAVLGAGLAARGSAWPATALERGLLAAWPLWSGLWLARQERRWLRDALTALASAAAVWVALGLT